MIPPKTNPKSAQRCTYIEAGRGKGGSGVQKETFVPGYEGDRESKGKVSSE